MWDKISGACKKRNVENNNDVINTFKIFQSIMAVLFLFGFYFIFIFNYKVQLSIVFWAFILNSIFAIAISGLVNETKKNRYFIFKIERNAWCLLNWLTLAIISPNRLVANYHKYDNLRKKVNERIIENPRNRYIKRINSTNLIIGIIIYFIVLGMPKVTPDHLSIFPLLILFRTVSRSFEIIIAFGKDCFSIKNKSNFYNSERIILATASLIENIFNYASVYYLFGESTLCYWQSFATSIQTNFFQNISLNMEIMHPDQMSLLSLLQFLTSFTLVIFSLAIYASGNKENTNIGKRAVRINKTNLHKPLLRKKIKA